MTGHWRSRLQRLIDSLTRRALPPDLDEEFEAHVDLAAADDRRQGHSPIEARRLASVRFGSRVAAREAVHDERGDRGDHAGRLRVFFATLAQDVARRSKELAVRVALGATTRGVAWLVVRGGLTPALVGLTAGLIASLGTNSLLSAQLIDVLYWDPLTLSVSGVVLVVAALAGCALPARRATRTTPLAALRLD